MNEGGLLVDRASQYARGFLTRPTDGRDLVIANIDGDQWPDTVVANTFGEQPVLHLHGSRPVNFPTANTGAGVQFGLAGFHTASETRSGRITVGQVLTATQETMLFDNGLYVNIHSALATGGEIRAQLIAVPEPSRALLGLLGVVPIAFQRRRR